MTKFYTPSVPRDNLSKKSICSSLLVQLLMQTWFEQGRIHGNPVADGWAGAEMQKLLAIQKCYRRTGRHGKV